MKAKCCRELADGGWDRTPWQPLPHPQAPASAGSRRDSSCCLSNQAADSNCLLIHKLGLKSQLSPRGHPTQS